MVEQANEKRLRDLVDRWEELRAQGVEPSAAELCKDAPELLGELQAWVRAMKATDWLSKPVAPQTLSTSGRPEDTLAPQPKPTRQAEAKPAETKPATAAVPTMEAFVAQLTASRLMTAAELQAFRAGLPADKQPADATALARELVQQGKLTRYQATAVFQNKLRGLVFGDYVVLDRIGAGGMGQVFKARHGRMDRVVALKLLPNAFSKNPESVKRFQREVKTAARLNHSHIVTAYDAGEQDGVHYLVMEYVEGSDLSGLVKTGGPMPIKQAVDCVLQAARGLEHAHAEGIIHRDIKPSNLLLDKKGTVKILDMGLARVDSPLGDVANDGLTNTGNIMGTIDYMAPEQALDTKHADHRADIYGLGCTLYFLLTGKRMYDEDTVMKKLLAHREAAIPSLVAVRPEVPANVDAVYQKMVAKRPADRFQSMSEARAALETALKGAAPLPVGGATAAAVPVAAAALPKGATVRKPAPQPAGGKRGRAAKQSSSRGLMWGGAAAAALLVLGLGGYLLRGVIFKYETPAGTVVVEVDQLGAEVTLDGDHKLTLRPSGGGEAVEVRANVGKHTLEVHKDGFKVSTKEFVLNDGEPGRIAVRLEPLTKAAVKSPEPAAVANVVDRDRQAAQWAIGAGGRVTVVTDGDARRVPATRLDELPRETFRLVTVDFYSKEPAVNLQVNDESLAQLEGLEHLNILVLDHTAITDAGIKHLRNLKALDQLNLSKTQVTDAGFAELRGFAELTSLGLDTTRISNVGLASLAGLANLHVLGLGNSRAVDDRGMASIAKLTHLQSLALGGIAINDGGLEQLKPLTELTSLVIGGPNLTDRGLDTVAGFTKLTNLVIGAPQVSDEGLRRLTGLQNLKRLVVSATRATAAGVESLRTALPKCKVEWHPSAAVAAAPAVKPAGAQVDADPAAERKAAEWALSVGGKLFVQVRGGTPVEITQVDQLPPLAFTVVEIDIRNNAQVGDQSLAALRGLSAIERLALAGTGVSDRGIEHIRLLSSLEVLNVSDTAVGDAGVEQVADLPHLDRFYARGTPITDRALESLARTKSLRRVQLGRTHITDAGLAHLAPLPLTSLTLGETLIGDPGLKNLQRCITLDNLSLNLTRATDSGIDFLAGMSKLRELRLGGDNITDAAGEKLAALKSLELLAINDTQISQAGYEKLRVALPGCKIEWSQAKAALAAAPIEPPAAAGPPAPIDPAVERKAAEWALSVGGKLFVQVRGGTPIAIARVDRLPPPPFTVYAIEIPGNPRVNDPSLAVLHGLNHLERLYLTETAVTDRGMEHVRTLKDLATLGVSGTTVGDAGVEQLVELPRLVQFFANGNPITDRGARSLARSKSIRVVHLNSTRVTDAGLAYLAQIPSLIAAELNNTSVGDVGLKNLQPCISIDHLLLTRTRVTDAGLGFLAGMSRLRHLELRADNITDRGVEKLAALKSLQDLAITETHISQAGYEKLQAALPGCKIEWSQAAPGAVASTGPATVVPLDTSNRLPVPSAADQQKALATLKDVFQDDFTGAKKAEDKAALAEKLLKQAEDSRDDPAAVYVMLGEARNLAGDAADAALTVRLISELGNRFQVDPLEMLAGDLERATQKSHPSAAFKAIAEAALEHIDEALDAEQFPLAKRLSDVALAAARKAKDPTTLKSAIERNKSLTMLKQQWDAAEEARATLAKTPDDPEANLALGRYLCFVRGDWAEGFEHLARGGDTTLKELATKSAADPQDAADQAELGEAWAQAADAAKGKSKPELQAGARYWYAKAQPALSGLAKAKADQRLKQLGSATSTTGSSTSTGRGSRRTRGNAADQLARDRAAAEWVLSLRGKVGIMAPWLPQQKMIELASDLPPQPFGLTEIDLFQNKDLTDKDLAHLEGLVNLRELRLEATAIGDAGLEHIKDLTNLISLRVNTTRVTDAGLANIRGLKNLQTLWLSNRPPITDAGLEQLKDMANLRELNLVNTRVTDAGMALLKSHPRLQTLQIGITPVTDAGLDRLQALPLLTELDLSQTQITDAGLAKLATMPNLTRITLRGLKLSDGAIAKLQAALPRCKIQL